MFLLLKTFQEFPDILAIKSKFSALALGLSTSQHSLLTPTSPWSSVNVAKSSRRGVMLPEELRPGAAHGRRFRYLGQNLRAASLSDACR